MIRAKAPLRISFAGGGTDVAPFPELEGGLVLNATIARYAYGTLRERDDDEICVESLDLGLKRIYEADDPLAFDGKLDLVKAALRRLADRERGGFDLTLRSSAPPGSGLGASSAVMVALVGLFKEARNLPLTDYDVAGLAHTIERTELGIYGGMQDQYAATFGGFNFIEFGADRVVVNPLRVAEDVVNELEHNLLLCFTGQTRESDHIIEDQKARFERREDDAVEALHRQKDLAVEMKDLLLRRRLNDFGRVLDEAWQAKRRMSPRVSNDSIDSLYSLARRHGALGGKITGAGGGGYMLLYCDGDRRHRVAEKLEAEGIQVGDVKFVDEGLRTWRASDS